MTEGLHSKVETFLEEVPGAEPRCWVKVIRPGARSAEELSYREILARPAATAEDKAVKREVSRQYRELMARRRLPTPSPTAEPPATAFEVLGVHSDRSPYADDFDPTKNVAIQYRLNGRERTDTPASLDRMIRSNPERFPAGAADVARRAVIEKLKALREECRPSKRLEGRPAAEDVPTPDPAPEDVPTANREALTPIVTEPAGGETRTAELRSELMETRKTLPDMAKAPGKIRTLKLLDVAKGEDGEPVIGAVINGESKMWKASHLEEEICVHSTQYPYLALEMLRDKISRWKASQDPKVKGRDAVDVLLELARQDGRVELFHDPARVPFVRVDCGGHREVKAVREDFCNWLSYRATKATGKAPKRDHLAQAIDTLAVLAQHEGDEREVCIRRGERDSNFYYDLCNDSWQAVRIAPEGWGVVDDPPIMFRRFDHMRPQAAPIGGMPAALDEMVHLVNTSEEMRRLLKYHLIASLVPRINHYNAFFLGPQGSTKSTGNDIFKALVDPGTDNRDALPKKEDDLDLHLSKRCTAAYDNISKITLEVSDMLTRANSMGRSSRRALYTDNVENSRRYQTQIVLNAIVLESGVRPDLLDRTIPYVCEVVTEAERMGQEEVNARVEALRPHALGVCLDILVKAKQVHQELRGRKGWAPRLKDAYLWMMAVAKVDGMAEADFEALFKKVIERRDSDSMEGDPLAVAIEHVAGLGGFAGTAEQLHEWLNSPGLNIPAACYLDAKDRAWPRSSIALGIRLPRLIAPLRSRGVYVYQCRHHEVGKSFTDKVRDLHWAKKGAGAYRDQDRMILISKTEIRGSGSLEARCLR